MEHFSELLEGDGGEVDMVLEEREIKEGLHHRVQWTVWSSLMGEKARMMIQRVHEAVAFQVLM